MRTLKYLVLTAVAAICFAAAPTTHAQVSVGIGIGVEPVCPYGYYDYAPYRCAPYGYYGPEWFDSGIFIGAGPWHHGREYFYGHVNNHYDPRHGYRGRFPDRGEAREEHHDHDDFHPNEMRDGNGHSHEDYHHH